MKDVAPFAKLSCQSDSAQRFEVECVVRCRERIGNRFHQFSAGNRFLQNGKCLGFARVTFDVVTGVRRNQDAGTGAVHSFEFPHRFDSCHDMHMHIKQYNVDPLTLDYIDGLFSGFGLVQDEERSIFEDFPQDLAKSGVVVGNEQLKFVSR